MDFGGLKVLHLVPSVGRIWGGLSNLVVDLAVAQLRQGLDPLIHCTDGKEGLARASMLWPIGDLVKSNPLWGPTSIRYSPRCEAWARSSDAARFEIAHQHGIWTLFSRVTRAWARSHNRPVIIAPQGSLEQKALVYSAWKKHLALWAYERDNLAHAACLQATTEGEIETFRRFGLRNPVAVIPNGIAKEWTLTRGDPARFRAALQLGKSDRVMLFLSRIHHKKGLHMLLESLHRLGDGSGDWHLAVVGPVENEHYGQLLDVLASDRVVASRVHFAGPLYGSQKRDAFAAAELFVLPTLSDNFAITIAEALGSGVPVLTTTGAMAWRDLERIGCGWITEPNVEAITQSLEHVLSLLSPELRQKGERGKHYVQQHYLWDHIAEKSAQLYRWLLGRTGKPSFVFCD